MTKYSHQKKAKKEDFVPRFSKKKKWHIQISTKVCRCFKFYSKWEKVFQFCSILSLGNKSLHLITTSHLLILICLDLYKENNKTKRSNLPKVTQLVISTFRTRLVYFNPLILAFLPWQNNLGWDTEAKWSGLFVSDSVRPHGLQPTRLLCPWDFLGNSTGVDCHFLLQAIFPTQGSNPGLPHCRQTLYRLSHQGSLRYWMTA